MKYTSIALYILAILAVGCVHEHTTGDHEHENTGSGNEGKAFTLYSDRCELFLETSPLEAGNSVELNAHLTEINDGHRPLEGAAISLLHVSAGKVLAEVKGQPRIPGIYDFVLEPLAAGEGDLVFVIEKNGRSDTLRLADFMREDNPYLDRQSSGSGMITFTKEQAWKSRFRVEPVTRKSFSEVILTSGEMQAMPGEKQSVIAKSDGIILFTSRNMVQGSSVKKGDKLFILSGEGLADNNVSVRFNETRARYQLSKTNYERQRILFGEKIVSEKLFREAESKYITDSVAYYALALNASNSGMNVFAPMSGYIHELNVTEGQYVRTGQKLATLSDNRIILLRADLPQQYYGVLDQIVSTTFRPAYAGKVYTLDELHGRLLAKGASVAENNHYMPVYFEVTNDGSLLEGAFAEFYLKTAPVPGRMVIPVTALVEELNHFYVYLQVTGEHYRKQAVTLAASDGLNACITGGLKEGERIVTEGTMLIKTATISSVPIHTHQH